VVDVVNVAPLLIMIEPVGGVKAYPTNGEEIISPKNKETSTIIPKTLLIFSFLNFRITKLIIIYVLPIN
jgi:hypothetical protein